MKHFKERIWIIIGTLIGAIVGEQVTHMMWGSMGPWALYSIALFAVIGGAIGLKIAIERIKNRI